MEHFIIKTQSISDVITNSSSELFVVKPKNKGITADIEKLIQEKAEEFYRRDNFKIEDIYNKYYEDRKKAEDEGKNLSTIEIKEPWETIAEQELESSSGMGGDIEVYDIHKEYKDRWYPLKHLTYDEYLDLIVKEEKTTREDIESRIYIDIDHNRHATIAWIRENFDIIEEEPC